jgi:hypothetical protein
LQNFFAEILTRTVAKSGTSQGDRDLNILRYFDFSTEYFAAAIKTDDIMFSSSEGSSRFELTTEPVEVLRGGPSPI